MVAQKERETETETEQRKNKRAKEPLRTCFLGTVHLTDSYTCLVASPFLAEKPARRTPTRGDSRLGPRRLGMDGDSEREATAVWTGGVEAPTSRLRDCLGLIRSCATHTPMAVLSVSCLLRIVMVVVCFVSLCVFACLSRPLQLTGR